MARWDLLGDLLGQTAAPVRLTWPQLHDLVGDLPASASRHRAWWSGDRPHVHVWRDAGYSISELALGEAVTFVRTADPDRASVTVGDHGSNRGGDQMAVSARVDRSDQPQVDLVLVTCVKAKLAVPAPARDLYISPLFRKQRGYAERQGLPWYILSAEHGLVAPDEWLAPYERHLPDTPASYRTAWGAWVVERLALLTGPLSGRLIEIHASARYIDSLVSPLIANRASYVDPLKGLSLGERLAWYIAHEEPAAAEPSTSPTVQPSGLADTVVERLRARNAAITPDQFLATGGAGLRVPGLYSWWVDMAGAADLTQGLDVPISAGLIYAGLAGATRWPSGKRSANTLWSRIAGMHLAGPHEFSTFRRTLGAILAHSAENDYIDEPALTAWMHQHLTVITVPYTDPDTLGRLETHVLRQLDPPLNLQGMQPTPVRHRVALLRRNHR